MMVGKAYRLYKGPIYLKFTYTVVYIYTYIYIYIYQQFIDKATDPELSLPNPVSFPDDRNRLFKTQDLDPIKYFVVLRKSLIIFPLGKENR